MSTELHDRLADLADDAPPRLRGDGLWERGRRRHRIRRAATGALVAVAVVGGVVAVQGLPGERRETAPIVDDGKGHLPREVFSPSEWSKGTSAEGEIGPLAVLGRAERAIGDAAHSTHYPALFGVSAIDGTVRFLDLPVSGDENAPGQWGDATLSPDGRKVGFVRYEGAFLDDEFTGADVTPVGWGVYDTVTGEITELADPESPEIEGMDVFEIEFTGDSRYLLTNYSRTRPATDTSDELVAWDVETGERLVMEGAGHFWLPNVGSAPRGVVWGRDHSVVRILPGGKIRDQRTVRLPLEVMDASWGPDDRAFAYVGSPVEYPEDHEPENPPPAQPPELYVGPTSSELRKVDLPVRHLDILGWRDAGHVVVAYHQESFAIVDVRTGDLVEKGSIRGEAGGVSGPDLAADFWANPLVDGVEPPQVDRPWDYRPWVTITLTLTISCVLAWLILRRRDRARA